MLNSLSDRIPLSDSMQRSSGKQTKMMHISKEVIAPRVIVCGDQARALLFSMLLDKKSIVFKSSNLDYDTYTGVAVTIASHGVGVAGAQVAFQELIHCGARVIIRAGTCGSLESYLRVGMMCIPHSFVRNEQVTSSFLPMNVPAICHYEVVSQLEQAATNYQHPHSVGMGITIAIYEPYGGPLGARYSITDFGFADSVEDTTKFWKTCGCSCIEMESSSLCLLGLLSNVKVGAILTIDGYVFENIDREKNLLRAKDSEENLCKNNVDIPMNPSLNFPQNTDGSSCEDDEVLRNWEYVVEFEGRKGEYYSAGKVLCPGIVTMCRIALDAIVNVSI